MSDYFQNKITGNIALAISLGLPIIGNWNLREYLPEVKCCALTYGYDQREDDCKNERDYPPLLLANNIDNSTIRSLSEYKFSCLRSLLKWLSERTEEDMNLIRKHILRSRDDMIVKQRKTITYLLSHSDNY